MRKLSGFLLVAAAFTLAGGVQAQQVWRTPFASFSNRDIAASGVVSKSGHFRELKWVTNPSYVSADVKNPGYSCEFEVSLIEMDRDVFVVFNDVRLPFELLVNGQVVGVSDPVAEFLVGGAGVCAGEVFGGGVSGRREFLIDDYIRQGANILEVRGIVGATGVLSYSPLVVDSVRFFGSSHVMSQPMVRIDDFTVRAAADSVVGGSRGVFSIEIPVLNSFNGASGPLQVWYEIEDASGKLVDYSYREIKLDNNEHDTVRLSRTLRNVKHWSAEHPNLYKLVLKVRQNGVFTEYTSSWFGFRNVQIVGRNTLLVNGREVAIKGVMLPSDIHFSDMKTVADLLVKLKKAGYNALSLHSNMPEAFYQLTDKLGFYVSQGSTVNTLNAKQGLEVGQSPTNDPRLLPLFTQSVHNIYRQHKNVTSIVLWELGAGATNGYNMQRSYLTLRALQAPRVQEAEPTVAQAVKDPMAFSHYAAMDRGVWYVGADAEWNSDFIAGQSESKLFIPIAQVPELQVPREKPAAQPAPRKRRR